MIARVTTNSPDPACPPSRPTYRVAVLVSGNGSNLQVLIDQMQAQVLPIKLVGVISNNPDAYALQRAKLATLDNSDGIATAIIAYDAAGKRLSRVAFEQAALQLLASWQPDLVVLAGFMRILTPLFIDGVTQTLGVPMINLHPSLLPAYKGLDTHQRVLQAGEQLHGCSVHLVTAELDAGTVIAQMVTQVSANDTAETLQQRVHTLEHQLLPMVVGLFASGLLAWQSHDGHSNHQPYKLVNHAGLPLPLRLFDMP